MNQQKEIAAYVRNNVEFFEETPEWLACEFGIGIYEEDEDEDK